ncbi:hypothetical protein GUITHDRAFT_150030, partial [Guillardia theta CCMP2712]
MMAGAAKVDEQEMDHQMKDSGRDMAADGAHNDGDDQDVLDNADSQADGKEANQQQRQKRTHWPKDD